MQSCPSKQMLGETAKEVRGALGRAVVTEPKGQSWFRTHGWQSKATHGSRSMKAVTVLRLAEKKSLGALVRIVPVDYWDLKLLGKVCVELEEKNGR